MWGSIRLKLLEGGRTEVDVREFSDKRYQFEAGTGSQHIVKKAMRVVEDVTSSHISPQHCDQARRTCDNPFAVCSEAIVPPVPMIRILRIASCLPMPGGICQRLGRSDLLLLLYCY
jgi:hypothetical protein